MVVLSVKDLSVGCKTLKNQLYQSLFYKKVHVIIHNLMKVLLMFQSSFLHIAHDFITGHPETFPGVQADFGGHVKTGGDICI